MPKDKSAMMYNISWNHIYQAGRDQDLIYIPFWFHPSKIKLKFKIPADPNTNPKNSDKTLNKRESDTLLYLDKMEWAQMDRKRSDWIVQLDQMRSEIQKKQK